MNIRMTQKTAAQARELARQLSVSHDLDPEIQEELYGHIEDKLLAYMNGDEALTEDDALILVREHFGDTKLVTGMLGAVHGASAPPHLGRRILAFITAAYGAQIASQLLRDVALPPLRLLDSLDAFTDHLFSGIAAGTLGFALLFVLLKRWRDAEEAGKSTWYQRWSLSRVLLWCGGSMVLSWLIPTLSVASSGPGYPNLAFWLLVLVPYALMACSCLLWLWWTGGSRRSFVPNLGLGIFWIVLTFARTLYPAKAYILLGDIPVVPGATSFATGNLGGTPVTGCLFYGGPWQSFAHINPALWNYAAIAFICCLAMAFWNQNWGKSRPAHTPHVQP